MTLFGVSLLKEAELRTSWGSDCSTESPFAWQRLIRNVAIKSQPNLSALTIMRISRDEPAHMCPVVGDALAEKAVEGMWPLSQLS